MIRRWRHRLHTARLWRRREQALRRLQREGPLVRDDQGLPRKHPARRELRTIDAELYRRHD